MMRMCDYDRLRYDDRDRPGTATSAPLQDVFALEHTKKRLYEKEDYMKKDCIKRKLTQKEKNKNREMVSKR